MSNTKYKIKINTILSTFLIMKLNFYWRIKNIHNIKFYVELRL